jgi:hypothetical protein
MPIFIRREDGPSYDAPHHTIRPLVRADFSECCAYCLFHELLAGGEDNFEIDHFRPRARTADPVERDGFLNLYYSCHTCNHYKSSSWPDGVLAEKGYRFVDSCKELFSDHFPAGEYSEARLRLNRPHLAELRSLLDEIAFLRLGTTLDWNRPSKEQILGLLPVALRREK